MEPVVKKPRTDESQPASLIENLLPEIKRELFRYLPVDDLKTLRLCSSRLSRDVMSEDKRFKVYTLKSSENLPQVFYSSAITVVIDNTKFKGDTISTKSWIKDNSGCISAIKFKLLDPEEEFLELLESSAELLQELHIEGVCEDRMIAILDQKFPNLKVLKLNQVDMVDRDMPMSKLGALEFIGIYHCSMKMTQFKDLVCESSHCLKTMDLYEFELEMDTDIDITFPSLSCLMLAGDCDYGWTLSYMKTLTTLWFDCCNYCDWMYQLEIQNLYRWSPEKVNSLLNKCPNLETRFLSYDVPNIEGNRAPGLKHLIIWHVDCDVKTFKSLLDSCRSSLEVLVVGHLETKLSHDLTNLHFVGGLNNLKELHIFPPLSKKKQKWLQDSLPHAQVYAYDQFSDCYDVIGKLI